MSDPRTQDILDAVIVGAGPAGLVTALAMKRAGRNALCVGPEPPKTTPDRRTTALLDGSVRLLDQRLDVWGRLEPLAAPLKVLRLIDRTGRLFRAPDTAFDAAEIGKTAFGYNIPNAELVPTLLEELGDSFMATAGVTNVESGPESVSLQLAEGTTLNARLAVGADGRKSLCRDAAGVSVRSWHYDQTAVVCNFHHSRPHHNACTEFHYRHGPFTVVPLPGDVSSLVWVERSDRGETLAALPDDAFMTELGERLDGLLGEITSVGPRGAFPLSGQIAQRLTGQRIALVGEAAHVMPPIGAQGLNLGFRDASDLIDCVTHADDPGAADTLAAYERRRRADVWVRTMAADLLNRTLISNIPLFQIARGAGLTALSMAAPLRRTAMLQGMSTADS